MPSDNDSKILPPPMSDRPRPQANRTVLGILVAILCVAVLLALWSLIVGNDSDSSSGPGALPTPFTFSEPTPLPTADVAATPTPVPTVEPVVTPTPVPAGFEACSADRSPTTAATYVVDTNTTPLNQRSEPAVAGALAGTFDPGQTGLAFTGECVVNLADGYVWWKIFNGTEDVWIASDFVTRR